LSSRRLQGNSSRRPVILGEHDGEQQVPVRVLAGLDLVSQDAGEH
jgi:hypothetical protein